MKKLDKRIVNRMNILFFLFLLFSLVVISKIFYIQNTYEDNPSVSLETIKNIEVESSRGNIYSENGDLIVSTVTKYELRWDSKIPSSNLYESNLDTLSTRLSIFFNKEKNYFTRYLNQARKNNNRYLLIGKNLSITDVNYVKSFPIFNQGLYKGGLIIKESHSRQSHLGKVAESIKDPKSTTGEKSWSTKRSSDDLNVFNDKADNWINFSV